MNKKILKIIFLTTTILIFGIIFNFSNQNGEKSEGKSRKIAEKIVGLIENIKNEKYSNREKYINKVDHIIRKIAHFTLYTIAGMSLMSFLSIIELKNKKGVIISVLIGLIYAISDEIHQIFIPERTAHVSDVLIDTSGIFFGSLMVIFILKMILKKY